LATASPSSASATAKVGATEVIKGLTRNTVAAPQFWLSCADNMQQRAVASRLLLLLLGIGCNSAISFYPLQQQQQEELNGTTTLEEQATAGRDSPPYDRNRIFNNRCAMLTLFSFLLMLFILVDFTLKFVSEVFGHICIL
jgi:hypothetical protein